MADTFCGYRQGLYGNEDVALNRFSIECKSRQTPLKTLEKWMQQAEENGGSKIPMLVFHVLNQNHEKDFVIFRADARVISMIQHIEVCNK